MTTSKLFNWIISVVLFVILLFLGKEYFVNTYTYIDSPCFVGLQDNVLDGPGLDVSELNDVEIFVDVKPAFCLGAACEQFSLAEGDSLDLFGQVFQAKDGDLYLDGARMGIPSTIEQNSCVKDIDFNVWYSFRYSMKLEVLGYADTYFNVQDGNEEKLSKKVLIVKGYSSTDEKLRLLTLIVTVLLITVFVMNIMMMVRRKKGSQEVS